MNEKSTSFFRLLLAQISSFLTKDRKYGGRRSGGETFFLGFGLLLAYYFLGFLFLTLESYLDKACYGSDSFGGDLIYAAVMFALALVSGIAFGTLAAAYTLYLPTDDKLSAAAKAVPAKLLAARMICVLITAFLGVWNVMRGFSTVNHRGEILYKLLLTLILSLAAFAFSLLPGGLLSFALRKVRDDLKAFAVLAVLMSGALIYAITSKHWLHRLTAYMEREGNTFGERYPLLRIPAEAAEHDSRSLLLLAAAAVLLFILAFSVLCLRQRKQELKVKCTE